MFESVCIRRQQPLYTSEPLDMGFLAEAMLFYQNVHLIADIDILLQLVPLCGPALLNEFIEEGYLQISYLEKRTSISKYNEGPFRDLYRPFTLLDAEGSWKLEKVAPEIFSRVAGGPGWGRQLGMRFAELVPTLDIGEELISAARTDFADQHYSENAVAQLLSVLAPTYRFPQDHRFKVSKEDDKFRVDTNIDFRQANESFNRHWQTTGDILSPSMLLEYVFEARNDVLIASRMNAELATQPGTAAIIDVKFRKILNARSKSQHNIEAFQEMVLANSHEIGESIKSGFRTWRDLLVLLKQARKFKEKFLAQKDPDASLTHEYIKALEKETWFGTPPMKVLHFLIFTGGGLLVPAVAALGLSAADTFIVDRLLGGWRPNQFVNGPLKGFARLD